MQTPLDTTLFALQQGAEPGAAGNAAYVQVLFWGLIIAIFYFLMIRPVRQREKRHREYINGLKSGDRVTTQGGILGTVVGIGDHAIQLRIADGVKVDITKNAVSGPAPDEN